MLDNNRGAYLAGSCYHGGYLCLW